MSWVRENGCPWDESAFAEAAGIGSLQMMEWLRLRDCPWDESACEAAAESGYLWSLQWLRVTHDDYPWDERTCWAAAGGGHLEVLQWAREHGCEWDKFDCFNHAEQMGHTEVMTWLHPRWRDDRPPSDWAG
jgi:hypothetical protein